MTEQTEETYVGAEQEYAPFWAPEPGEAITGRMVSVHVMQGDYGPTPVVTVDNATGQHAILVRGTIFREEMAQRKPKVGDVLTITYFGKKKPKSGIGQPYHVYKVQGGTEPEFDWNAFVPSDRQASQPQASNEPPIPPAPVGQFAEQQRQTEQQATSAAAEQNFGSEPPF